MGFRKPYTLMIFLVIAAVALCFIVQFRWTGFSGKDWETIIEGDGKDYYAYLDQIFIRHNFGSAPVNYDQTVSIDGSSVIKAYCGTALLISPFFLASLATSAIFGLPVDGYTEVYQKPVSFAALFYLMLGLFFIYRLLMQFQMRRVNIYLTLVFIFFATNLLNYVVVEPAMSHAYSFSMIAGFLWASERFIREQKMKHVLMSALFLGIIYLIRPVNMVIAGFVLFFFENMKAFILFMKKHNKKMLFALPLLLLVMSLQHLLWLIQCGSFFVWPYPHEGFYLLHPAVFNVLFSFRKGLFIYTPFILITLLGLIAIFRQNKFRLMISLVFVAAIVYLISAWWCWTYFDGFGMRPFIDFFPVFAVFFAFLLDGISKWLKRIIIIMCALFLTLNLVQIYQYNARIIHPEYMNYESYKFVFMKTSSKYSDWVGGSADLVPYNKFNKTLIAEKTVRGDTLIAESDLILSPYNKDSLIYFDDLIEYNKPLVFENDTSIYHSNATYAEISMKKWDIKPYGSSKALLVVTVDYGGPRHLCYSKFLMNYLPDATSSQWKDLHYTLILPVIREPAYKLSFYIWNKGFQFFLIRDMNVKVFRTA